MQDRLDETMRTRVIRSINSKAALKALFKVKDNELTFAKAIATTAEVEDAAKVAKETVHGQKVNPSVLKLQRKVNPSVLKLLRKKANSGMDQKTCFWCGKNNHTADKCRHKTSTCNYYKKLGHIEPACRTKRGDNSKPKWQVKTVNIVKNTPELHEKVHVHGQNVQFEVNTGAGSLMTGRGKPWENLSERNPTTL